MEPSTLDVTPSSNSVPAPSSSRKRKREVEKVVLGDSFVIGPYSSSVFDSSLKLTPAVALPRSFVPLQWLAGTPSRLFSFTSNLPVLGVPGNILVAKVDGERQLAAVEKVQDGVYAIFKLSTQLKMRDVRKTVALARKAPHEPPNLEFDGVGGGRLGSEWWSHLRISDCTVKDLLSSPDPVGTLTMGSPDTEPLRGDQAALQAPTRVPVPPSPGVEALTEESAPPTLSDILENTRKQYFKTLYIAKTSLAYFAKSTLSRARVAMRADASELPAGPGGELIIFLQSMLLPFEKMDIKFRSIIPKIALEEKVQENEVLRAGEEEYVQEWRSASFQDKLVRASDQWLKRRVEELKIREYAYARVRSLFFVC
ncbi:unnamed protein product [Tuber melanosporum]|uniref:(Perigord truffle) hypothetical protein n=1 Tax=Tuber melanosporum (strain Mel28) TaxID=656061 RepID=D5G6X1_TUBMM|nr:uncharacterized protein GSTUM_00002366001 [Tuber melanosporum]CAZ80264.1 unnamed protein product [Tuber melanosporum]